MASITSVFSSFVEDNSIGTITWNNEAQAASSDNLYATTNQLSNNISVYLKCTNPASLSIPVGATITGIKIAIERKALNVNSIKDYSIRLVKGGTIQGDNKADTSIYLPIADTSKDYGSSSDLWGLSWLYSDFGSTFGVVISYNAGFAASFAYVDAVTVTVYYELTTTQTESLAIAESLTFLSNKALAEGISLAEVLTMLIRPTYTESLAIADVCAALKVIPMQQAEAITIGDFIEFLNGKVYTEDISVADVIEFLIGLMQTENLTITDTLNFLTTISSSENITISDAVTKLIQKINIQGITISDIMSAYVFIPNVPLSKYGTRILIDMMLDSGTLRFSTEDIYITEPTGITTEWGDSLITEGGDKIVT